MLKSVGSFWWRRSASCIISRTCSGHSESNNFHAKSNVEKVETVDVKRSRLQYQSRKRGMLENCILLSTFSEKYLPTFTSTQLDLYDHLLNDPSNDWDIYYWATGLREAPLEFQNEVMGLLKVHVKNHEKQPRSLHPKLLTDE